MSRLGAKARMSIMQGRGLDACCSCHEDDGKISPCGTCGDLFCKECMMEHDCADQKKDKKGHNGKKKP